MRESAGVPAVGHSRIAAGEAGGAGRRRRAGESRAGYGRQAAVHVRLDRDAQGRHQHAAMMTSNQAMVRAVNPSYGAEPPVLIDWLPWSHTFGGNNNFNLVLSNGGSFYIDGGRPLPGAIEETVRNLREVSPTVYYNVPRGFEMLLPYLQADEQLRRSLFGRLQSFCYAGAALRPSSGRSSKGSGLRRSARSCRC